MALLKRILHPPQFVGDEEKGRIAGILYSVMLWGVVLAIVCTVALVPMIGMSIALVAFLVALTVCIILVSVLTHIGAVRPAAALFIIGWISVLSAPNVYYRVPGVSMAVAALAIPFAGIVFREKGVKYAATFYLIGVAVSLGIPFIVEPDMAARNALAYSLVGYSIIGVVTAFITHSLVDGTLVLHRRVRAGEEALKHQNDALAAEIAERRQAQSRQAAIMMSLESILHASEELMMVPTLDALWHKAVEIGRDRLGFERCGIFLYDSERREFCGTYVVDMRGQIYDAHKTAWPVQQFPVLGEAMGRKSDQSRWYVNHDTPVFDSVDGTPIMLDLRTWIVGTPIRAQSGDPMGVMLNDSAITNRPLDPVQQDLLSVYVSMLGNIAQRKMLELRLQEANADLEHRVADRTRALAHSEERFRSLVQHSQDIFAIIDDEGVVAYANPALCRLSGYSVEQVVGQPAAMLLHPDDVAPALQSLGLTADSVYAERTQSLRLRTANGQQTWLEVASVVRPEDGMYYVTAHDISERLRAEAAVQRQVDLERLVSAVSLRFMSLSSNAIDEGVLYALREVGTFVGADIGRVFLETDDSLAMNNTHEWCRQGVASQKHLLQGIPIMTDWRWWRQTLVREGVLRYDDITELRKDDPESFAALSSRDVSAVIIAPIVRGTKVVGDISFDVLTRTHVWTDEDLTMLRLCAGLISNALGRAAAIKSLQEERNLLEQRVAERTSVLARVLELSNGLTAMTERDALLQLILTRLRELMYFDTASISVFDEDGDLRPIARYNDAVFAAPDKWDYDPVADVHITDALQRRRPVSVPDVTADTPYGRAFRSRQSRRMGFVPTTVRSALYVPLVFQDRTLGLLAVTSQEANYYTQQRSDLAYAFANYAAAAIENSKVYSQSVRAAALEERSRLARELHDSVSQALFGIVLGTRTALHRIGEQPAEAEDPMKYVLSLAEAALAEMRALIFELRPESLQQQGLINAFRKQAEALCARHKIDVRVDLDAREPDLSLELKEALYRVALEAIQNTIKHAHATRVDLTLKQTQDSVHLEVIDNGLGFDPKQAYPGHYGLQTMQERIVRVGGQVNISSKLGEGTTVRVWVPAGAALPARPDGPLQLNAGQLQTL